MVKYRNLRGFACKSAKHGNKVNSKRTIALGVERKLGQIESGHCQMQKWKNDKGGKFQTKEEQLSVKENLSASSRNHAYIMLTPLNPTFI